MPRKKNGMPKPLSPGEISSPKGAWKNAKTFQDLCELMALFVEGKLPFSPSCGADTVDSETTALVPYLARFNRSGFLTLGSQPGEDSPEWKQRAFVDGFALEPIARRIARLSLYSDLHIVVAPPGFQAGFHTPVVINNFMPHGWAGFSTFEEIDDFAECCEATAIEELCLAWSVSVIDLQWGRTEHLWRELAREICYSERPHPDLELEVDFAV